MNLIPKITFTIAAIAACGMACRPASQNRTATGGSNGTGSKVASVTLPSLDDIKSKAGANVQGVMEHLQLLNLSLAR